MTATTLYVLLVIFAATLIRSAFGFGEALIAVPLLALRIPVGIAAPLAVLLSITVAAVVVVQGWEKVHVRSDALLSDFTVGRASYDFPGKVCESSYARRCFS